MVNWDVRLALRRQRSRPAATAMLIAIIAVGIGAAAAVFSVVDQTLLRPAPFLFHDRLISALDTTRRGGGGGNSLTPAKIAGWQQQSAVFERFEAVAPAQFDLTHEGPPERVLALYVTPGLFSMLGVSPAFGRAFAPADGQPGSARVAIISDALWHRRFGGGADALGRTLTLNGDDYTVVGVLPRRLRLISQNVEVWLPYDIDAHLTGAAVRGFYGFGRLAKGVAMDAAQRTADAVADRLQREAPLPRTWNLYIRPLQIAWVDAPSKQALYVLLGAVAFLLLIMCANVASLLLAQAPQRIRDMAIASAIGSTRARLVRSVLVETVLLAAAGGALGILLARWALDAILAIAPKSLSWQNAMSIELDGRVVAIAFGVTLLTGLAIGLLPAWRGSRRAIDAGLRGASRSTAASFGRAPGALIALEVAFSLVLLTGAALMARTLVNLNAIAPGFDPNGVISMHVDLPSDKYRTSPARAAFFDAVMARLAGVRGVHDSAVSQGLPPDQGGFSGGALEAEGRAAESATVMFPFNTVSPAYFRTLRIPIVAGRTFAEVEQPDAAIVSQAFADRLWPSASAMGRRFRVAGGPWKTVVGVVGTVESRAGGEIRTPLQVYWPLTVASGAAEPAQPSPRRTYAYRVLVVRADNPLAALPAIQQAIWSVDRDQPIDDVALATEVYAEAFGRQRFVLILMIAFSAIALTLTMVGLIGVLSQLVARRTREIGIRVALGAAPRNVLGLVLRQGVTMIAIGAVLGIGVALALTRTLQALLFEVRPSDPATFAIATICLCTAGLAACWLPVRAALRIAPVDALRTE
jgi:putative ABC transport system permease protein